MRKLTIPRAILIGSLMIALAILFRTDDATLFVGEAEAEVAGMGYLDLRRDRDFKKAVEYIVESCTVSGEVSDGEIDSADISC